MFIPRFRGKIGQGAEDERPEYRGKWFFNITVAQLDGSLIGEPIGPIGPWETEQKAMEELKKAIRICAETYEKKVTGGTSGKYIDLKNDGVLRDWDEH